MASTCHGAAMSRKIRMVLNGRSRRHVFAGKKLARDRQINQHAPYRNHQRKQPFQQHAYAQRNPD